MSMQEYENFYRFTRLMRERDKLLDEAFSSASGSLETGLRRRIEEYENQVTELMGWMETEKAPVEDLARVERLRIV